MMLFSPSVHIVRQSRQFLLSAIVSFMLAFLPGITVGDASGQNLTFRPPQIERGGVAVNSVLFRANDIVTLGWEEVTSGLTFRIGLEPGEYGFSDIQMRGTQQSQFSPEVVGLPVGIYYGVLTNSSERTFAEIQIDASSDPDIRYSREIRFAVESNEVARLIQPRETISEPVPTFGWEAASGVSAYVLVVSSTPWCLTGRDTGARSALKESMEGRMASSSPSDLEWSLPGVSGQVWILSVRLMASLASSGFRSGS
jgi:hypothetical protein